jgi:hypothetical protein
MLRPGATATEPELQAFVGDHLAAFKVPARIDVGAAPLPPNNPVIRNPNNGSNGTSQTNFVIS